jgi:hypothetical protein
VHQTGVLGGGALSVNADTTKFDVAAGNGVILDYANPNNPVKTEISWDSSAAITVTGIAANGITAVFIDNTGAIVQSTAATAIDYRTKIFLGLLVHADRVNIDDVINEPALGYDGTSDFRYKTEAISHDSGLHYSAYATNLQIERTAGSIYREGLAFQGAPNLPSIQSASVESPSTFPYWYVGASSSLAEETAAATVIDPSQYNNAAAGTLVAVPTDKWTIQRIYAAGSDSTFVMYGQEVFDSKDDALAAVGSETFVEPTYLLQTGVYRYALIVQEGATDLSDTAEAEFKEITDTGGLGGGGGGGGTTTFLGLTDSPSTYSGQAGKIPKVNSGETGLEFGTAVGTFLGLTDTPGTYSGQAGKIPKVNSSATGLEFSSDVPQVHAVFVDQKTNGTDGGGSTASTWVQRNLNTTEMNTPTITLGTNQFTIGASGKYLVSVRAPGNAVDRHRVRLYNVSDTVVVETGMSAMCGYVWEETQTLATLEAQVNQTASSKTYRIDHWCARTVAGYGFGKASSAGVSERYTTVEIHRVGPADIT